VRPPETYRVTPRADCVRAENLNGLVFLYNGCDQEVRAYWCVELQADASETVLPAGCAAVTVAETKPVVVIESQQSAPLVVPVRGGNLQVSEVRQVHFAACPIRTRDMNQPHHFELSYSGSTVVSRCLEKSAVRPGQRSRLVEIETVPGQAAMQVRLIDAAR
jgi:hypothetical protein